jgi:polar amino acid transport system substrate-binding protein
MSDFTRKTEGRTMRILRIIGVMLAVVMFMTGLARAETLEVGAYPTNPPWEYKNDQNEFVGFEVDLVKEIARRINVDLNIQNLGFQALFAATSSGRIDMAISTITITNERLQNQAFTQGYFDSDMALVARTGGPDSEQALKGKVVGALASSTGEKWAKENQAKLDFSDYRSYPDYQGLLLDVQNGRLDAGVSDYLGLEYATANMNGVGVTHRIVTGDRYGIMMPKGSPWLAKVNAAISDIKRDGTLAKIHEKWLETKPGSGTSTVTVLPIPKPM